MASPYSAQDQAADLGIHRVHNLVLGDPRKEARLARFSPPQLKRPVLGRGDVRMAEHQYEWETRRELERIARRHNLKADNTGYDDENTLTDKIKAWGTLKVEQTIARPDGLGTGNAHRGGPNYRPIATVIPIPQFPPPHADGKFGQPRRFLPPRPIRPNAPGGSTFSGRRYLPPAAGSAAAAWQAAALGKQFQAFALGGNRYSSNGIKVDGSSLTVGRVRARSPIRTPARKSVVGSPRPRIATPAVVVPPPVVAPPVVEASKDPGPTYADHMARFNTTISSEHAPPKPAGVTSPTKPPMKVTIPPPHSLDGSRWSPTKPRTGSQTLEGSRWSGKLATASDPYFQNPPGSPVATPQSTNPPPPVPEQPPLEPPAPAETSTPNESIESAPPTDTAPNTPASITTSTAIEIEEYLDLLEAEEEEEDCYNPDPYRLQRDLEINERVNKSLAEAETAALAREILFNKPERKTVQFAPSPTPTPHEEELDGDLGEGEVMTKMVYVWNTFRDFATARSVTGFEEFVPEPRSLKEAKTATNTIPQSAARGVAELPQFIVVHGKVIKLADVAQGGIVEEEKSERVAAKVDSEGTKNEMREEIKDVSVAAKVEAPKAVAPAPKVELPTKEPMVVAPPPPSIPAPAPTTAIKLVVTPPTPSPQPWPAVPPTKLAESHKSLVPSVAPIVEPPKVTPALPLTPKPVVEEQPPKLAPAPQAVKYVPVPASQPKLPPFTYPKLRKDLGPLNALKNVEPAKVANTWDMPNIPSVKVSMKRSGVEDAGNDEFLEGLSASKKVEEKPVVKKVVIEEPKPVEIDSAKVTVKAPVAPVAPPSVATEVVPAAVLTPAPAAARMKLPELRSELRLAMASPPPTPGPHSFAAIATPLPNGPTFSPPPSGFSSAHRSGMPVPMPPTPRPAIKSPTKASIKPAAVPVKPILPLKPIVAPKPANLVSTPKPKATISPLVGGLVDPFLASLQPTTKKEPSTPVRPKTPSYSSDSADSTPKKDDSPPPTSQKGLKIETPVNASSEESAPTSPTSLSSSWTLIEKTRKHIGTKDVSPLAPPASMPTQAAPRKPWFSSADAKILPLASPLTTTPTPVPTPVVAPTQPTADSSAKAIVPPNGRKLFTFELKVGQAIVSTPVHELDNPRAVAESFAKEHNLESRLPGGRFTVDKIIGYFETQFADRKAEREKRRAERRERTKSVFTADQQK